MGREIVYCYNCQKRILGADFEKGLAYEVGNKASCSACAADLLKTLPVGDREQLLKRMFHATQARAAEALEPPAVPLRPSSTRRIPVVSPPPGSSATVPLAIGATVVAVVIVVALITMSGSAERTPPPALPPAPKIVEPRRADPPPPAIPPEEARRIEAARAALKKARDFAAANPTKLEDQTREWEQARGAAEGTPFFDEAKRELAAIGNKVRERVARELAEPINSGLVGYWKLDESSGTIAADLTPAARHGTLKGGASWEPGKVGGAVALDGAGGHVAVPHQDEFNTFPLTACAWVRTSGRNGSIVNKYVSGSHSGYQIYVLGGRVRAWYFRDRQSYVWDPKSSPKGTELGIDGGAIGDGRWHHVALVVDPAGGRFYVDGTWKSSLGWTGTPGSTSTPQELAFGRYPGRADAPDGYLSGSVDEVRIYNRALSDLEVRQLATPQ